MILFLLLKDFDIFNVATSKDDVLKLLLGCRNEIGACSAVFCAIRINIFEGNSRVFRINFMKRANVANILVSGARYIYSILNIPDLAL